MPRREFVSPTLARMAPLGGGETYSSAATPDQDDFLKSMTMAKDSERMAVIAQGRIVAKFAGGLTAVRISDDDDDDDKLLVKPSPSLPKLHGPRTPQRSSLESGGDLQGRNVLFDDGSKGIVVAHRPPLVFVYTTSTPNKDFKSDNVSLDGLVQVLKSRMDLEEYSGSQFVGRRYRSRDVFAPIPQVTDIALINNPVLTGITMFDALAPIGRGQNMLFVGHDLDDMRKYTMDFLYNQLRSNPGVQCIYAAIDDANKVDALLDKQGIRKSVQVVSPQSVVDENTDELAFAAEAVVVAAQACAMAEWMALQDGAHTIVVIDTLDWHKKLWDGTTRVLVDVFGVDAVVRADREGGASSEMRTFFSTLVQRAAQFNVKRGGGSVTLFLLSQIPPIQDAEGFVFSEADFENSTDKVKQRIQLLTQRNVQLTVDNLRKVNIPIPSAAEGKRRFALQHVDDLISMSDGQIWLDEKLQNSGQFPPMDPQRSITRVGIGADTDSRADAPAFRRIVEGLRLMLSQGAHVEGAEENTASIKQIRRQKAFLLAMHQVSGTGGRTLSESCAALMAAFNGYLDEAVENGALAGTEKGEATIQGLLQHLQSSVPDLMREIDESLDLSENNKKALAESIESFMRI